MATTGIAIGENASASAVNSIAIGDNTTAAAGHVALNTFDTMDAQGNIIPARLGAVTGGLSFLSSSATTAEIIAAYNGLLTAMGKENPLPYDAEIEYIESTGTQYIDTGIVPDAETGFWEDIAFSDRPARTDYVSGVTGQTGSSSSFRFAMGISWNNSGCFYFGVGTTNYNIDVSSTARVTIWIDAFGKTYGHGNKSYSISNQYVGFSQSNPLYIFARRNGSSVDLQSKARLFSSQIKKAGSLVRDFVPVRVGSVGYMYDRVSGQLFGNAGTGSFVLGPDV